MLPIGFGWILEEIVFLVQILPPNSPRKYRKF